MSSYPYIPFTNKFNPNDFTEIDGSLSLADADLRYFKISGGTITGFCTFLNSLDVIGTLSINSVPINLSLISGVTAGTPVASKVLSLDASSNINGNITVIGDINTSTILRVQRTSNGQSFNSTNGTSSCVLYHFNNADAYFGTSTSNNLVFQTFNTARMTINGSTGAISGISSLSTTSLIVNGVSINSSDIAYLSGITVGTVTASKAIVVDANKDISGLNIISSNGIVLTPTTYTLTSPNIPGCLWRTNSSRLSAFREIDTNNWSWGYSGGGLWNDILVMSNSTYRITVNGDLNYTGSLRSSGTVVLDSSRNLTCNSASVRNNSQTSGTRVEYLSIGRETGSDYGAWSLQNYYQSATSQQANYCTFTPSLKTSLTSGYGICVNQSGQVSFQDVNAGSGAGGIKTAANIIGCVDIYGGKTNNISSGHGYLQPDSGSPADYNGSSVSTRCGLFVENAIWTADQVYASSDRRLKRNIEPIELLEAKRLLNVNAVSYRLKRDKFDNFKKNIGFIAQDVIENGLDKLVSYCPNNNKDDFPEGYNYGIEYNRVSIYLLELIKDLYKQIDELKKN